MHFNSPTYRDATTICNALLASINDPSVEARDRALCAREWLAIAFAKREWRGAPRLKPHTLREVLEAKTREAKTINAETVAITESPDDEGTMNHPQTVPTPPEGEGPMAPVVGNDK